MPATPGNALNISSAGVVSFTGTAFAESALTQHDTLVGGASQAIGNVTPGTAGAVLISGGAGADPSYVVPTAGAGVSVTTNSTTLQYSATAGFGQFVLLQTQTASSSASITFTSGISATYTNYLLLISNLKIASGSDSFLMQFSSNGGSSYITTGYTSGVTGWAYNSTSLISFGTSTTGCILLNVDTTYNSNLVVNIFDLTNSVVPTVYGIGASRVTTPTSYFMNPKGVYGTGTAMNAIKLFFTSQNIATGTFSLYGIAQ